MLSVTFFTDMVMILVGVVIGNIGKILKLLFIALRLKISNESKKRGKGHGSFFKRS